jgi:glycosyltransferase involved in cell wall biosynthesis
LTSKDNIPLVSICIPCYNSEKTILKTLNSILNQTYQNFELLISDNHSLDNTIEICEKIGDPRIRIFKNNENIGAGPNFNKVIELATGKFIAIFHADDVYCPTIIEKQIQTFQKNPSIGAVFTMTYYIDENDNIIGERKLPKNLKNKKQMYFCEIFINILEHHNSFLTCPSVMIKGEIGKKLVPLRTDIFGPSIDLDIWFIILNIAPIVIIDEKLMKYRLMGGGYQIDITRVDEADFFKVMDAYLPIARTKCKIPKNSINRYELLRNNDRIKRSMNMILLNDTKSAQSLLNESISLDIICKLGQNFFKNHSLLFFIVGIILYFSTYFSNEMFVAKIFKKIMYFYHFM